jgi:hypothetical protein
MKTDEVFILFYRPCTWWGWLIAAYQLLRGVKYWQLVHCEIMTDEGHYAYRINEVLHGSFMSEFQLPTKVVLMRAPMQTYRYTISKLVHRIWGDFSPLSPFNGNHCTRYCKLILCIETKANLPGELCYVLEKRNGSL